MLMKINSLRLGENVNKADSCRYDGFKFGILITNFQNNECPGHGN